MLFQICIHSYTIIAFQLSNLAILLSDASVTMLFGTIARKKISPKQLAALCLICFGDIISINYFFIFTVFAFTLCHVHLNFVLFKLFICSTLNLITRSLFIPFPLHYGSFLFLVFHFMGKRCSGAGLSHK